MFIIEGTYELTVDGQTSTVGSGAVIFVPRNAVHRFENVGNITACMLGWSLPGGQDHYLLAGDIRTCRRWRFHRRKCDRDMQEVLYQRSAPG